eukprot:1159364-Pelagomonas_calceolata.AAC.1
MAVCGHASIALEEEGVGQRSPLKGSDAPPTNLIFPPECGAVQATPPFNSAHTGFIATKKHGLALYTMHYLCRHCQQQARPDPVHHASRHHACISNGWPDQGYSTPVLLHDSIRLDPQLRNEIVGFIQRTASVQLALTADYTGQDADQGFLNKDFIRPLALLLAQAAMNEEGMNKPHGRVRATSESSAGMLLTQVKQHMFAEELQEGRDVAINMVRCNLWQYSGSRIGPVPSCGVASLALCQQCD